MTVKYKASFYFFVINEMVYKKVCTSLKVGDDLYRRCTNVYSPARDRGDEDADPSVYMVAAGIVLGSLFRSGRRPRTLTP